MNPTNNQKADEIWAILKENSTQIKELRASQKETDELIQKTQLSIRESIQDLSERQKKTDEQMKATDKKLNKMFGNLGNDWGKLGENLVTGNLAKRLSERGIKVDRVINNLENPSGEFDIIAINGKEIVVVEVKSKLGMDDVEKFLSKIKTFNKKWPDLTRGKKVYGALAFLVSGYKKAITQAKEEGFFIISATGDVIIKNKPNFQPTNFLN